MTPRFLIVFCALCALFSSAVAQQNQLTGKVTTSDGKPVEFVSVALVGTMKGAVTDNNGAFEIKNIQAGTYTVFASLVGTKRQEKTIDIQAGQNVELNFVLTESAFELSEIIISGARTNKFYNDSAFVIAKLPLKDIENPQVYNSVSNKLLKEQAVTNLNDAIKNATGVTRLWESTGRGGDGAEFYSMRGFAVQPTMVNGMPSVNNGGLDPANVESIDVIKGPSGTLFGSPMISYGGLINVTTKKPYDAFGGEIGLVNGSNGMHRLTADVNIPLNTKFIARINTSYHNENSFQDAGFTKAFFLAPSFTVKPSDRLTFHVNTEILSKESANAPMIFLNRYDTLTFHSIDLFERNYTNSFTSNDLTIKNPSVGLQAQALYKISNAWTSQTVLSRSNTKTNGYYHYLWDLSDGDSFFRYISKRNGETITTNVQQNFIGDFTFGKIRNRMVVGLDYFESGIINSSTGWVGNGIVTLSNAVDSGDLTQAGVDNLLIDSFEGNSKAESRVVSAYVSDVVNLTSFLSAMASVRVDRFEGKTAYWSEEEVEDQFAVSPKFGLVFQPVKDRVSLFANYQNGFVNVTPVEVTDVDGSNARLKIFEPEQANQYEFGVKTNVYKNRVSLTASYYNITVSNRVMTDPENISNSTQGGEVESKGIEVSVVANPVNGLNIVAGFSDNDSEVTKDDPAAGYLGLRPEEAGPEMVANGWISYTFQRTALKGFGLGVGGNYASEHKTLNRANTGTFTLPAYAIFNASVSYTRGQFGVIVKVNNLTDEKYYGGWSTVTPQNLRNICVSTNFKF